MYTVRDLPSCPCPLPRGPRIQPSVACVRDFPSPVYFAPLRRPTRADAGPPTIYFATLPRPMPSLKHRLAWNRRFEGSTYHGRYLPRVYSMRFSGYWRSPKAHGSHPSWLLSSCLDLAQAEGEVLSTCPLDNADRFCVMQIHLDWGFHRAFAARLEGTKLKSRNVGGQVWMWMLILAQEKQGGSL